jgi:tape measure domain-containing protein
MADDVQRRIIYLEVNSTRAVDGSTALTKALADVDRGAASAGQSLAAIDAASISAGSSAQRAAADISKSTGLIDQAYRTATGSVLAFAKANTEAMASAASQANGYAMLAQQRIVEAGKAQSRALMDSVASSTAAIKAMYAGIPQVVPGSPVPGQPRPATPGPLTPQQKLMLGYQFNDIFTQAASGASPFMIAAQQGPQITQVFGGIGNTLAAIPKSLLVGGGIAAGAAGLAAAVVALKDLNDALETQKRRLGDMVGDQRLAAQAYDEIRANALAAGEAIDKTAAKFEQFARAGASVGATTGQTGSLLSIFNELGKLGGATQNEQSAAAGALAQALKDSVVSASSLDTILENMPGLGRRIADGLGLSVAQLKLMASEGDLTNKQVFDGLLSQQAKVDTKFKEAGLTVGSFFRSGVQGAEDLAIAIYKAITNIELLKTKAEAAKHAQQANPTRPTRATPRIIGNTGSLEDMVAIGEGGLTDGSILNDASKLTAQFLDLQKAQNAAADAAVLAGSKIADKLLPDLKTLQQQTDDINKALDALQKGFTTLDATKAAQEAKRLTDALVALQQKTPYGQAVDAVNTRQAQDLLGMTPGQRAYSAKVDQLAGPGGGAPSVDAAQGVVDQQQLQMLDDLIAKNQLELATQTAITQAMRGGKAAADDAAVAMQVLGISLDQLGKITPEAQVKLDVLAETLSEIRGQARAQASIDASKPLIAELNGIAAAMKVVEQGAYAVKRAQAEAKAAANDNGTGALEMKVFDAQQALTDATTLSNLQKSVDLTNQLAAAAGDVARQKQIQLEYDIKQAQQAAGPGAQVGLAEKMRAQYAADLNRQLKEGVASQQLDLDLTQKQLDIIRSGAPDQAAQLAMLQKRNDLLKQYGAAYADGPDGQKQVAQAGQKARLDEQLQFEKDAADATKRTWQTAYDNIQSAGADAFYNVFTGVSRSASDIATEMKNIFLRAFAEIAAAAIIRPVITPLFQAGALAGIIPSGVVPSATGSTGGGILNLLPGGGSSVSSPSGSAGLGSFLPGGGLLNLASSFGGGASIFSGFGSQIAGIGSRIGSFFGAAPATYSNVGSLIASGSTGASVAAGGGLSAAMSAIPVWGWISAAATLAKQFTADAPSQSPLGIADTLLGPSLNQWMSNPLRSAYQVFNPLGPIGAAIGQAFGFDPFGGPKMPPMPGLGYVQGTVGFGPNGEINASGQNAGDAANIGTNVLNLIKATGGAPIGGKLYGGTVARGTNHTWNGSYWQGQDYSQANIMDPAGNTSFIGGTGIGVDFGHAADLLTGAIFQQDVLHGAISGLSDSLTKTLETIFANISQATTQAASDAITFAKAYDAVGKAANPVKDTIDQLSAKFADLTSQASAYGLSLDPINAELSKETKRTAQDFIDNMLDPLAVQMRALDDERQSALASAQYIKDNVTGVYVDMDKVVAYYTQKQATMIDQFYGGAVESLQQAIDALKPGGSLSNLDPTGTLAGLKGTYEATLAQAMANDPTAIGNLANAGTTYLDYYRGYSGGDANYSSARDAMLAAFQSVQAAIQVPSNNNGAPLDTSNPGIANLVTMQQRSQAQIDQQTATIAELTDKLTAMTNLLSRYVSNRAV